MRRFSPSRDDRSERAKNSAAEISRKIAAPFYRGRIMGGILRAETDALFRNSRVRGLLGRDLPRHGEN